jgi:hypothetical protein
VGICCDNGVRYTEEERLKDTLKALKEGYRLKDIN